MNFRVRDYTHLYANAVIKYDFNLFFFFLVEEGAYARRRAQGP